jgi:hypothetical protein
MNQLESSRRWELLKYGLSPYHPDVTSRDWAVIPIFWMSLPDLAWAHHFWWGKRGQEVELPPLQKYSTLSLHWGSLGRFFLKSLLTIYQFLFIFTNNLNSWSKEMPVWCIQQVARWKIIQCRVQARSTHRLEMCQWAIYNVTTPRW